MIRLDDIVKHFDGGLTKALDGVSCHIAKGEVVALMGHSGAGKSTLLNIIGTIDRPSRGDVRIDGRSWEQLRPHNRFRARCIGFVFQSHYLLSHLTVQENIEIPMYGIHNNDTLRRRRALALLEAVGLGHKAAAFPNNLSGGERQRIAVARSLVNSPQIILADEPTGSVDTVTGNRIMNMMIGHCRDSGLTMVVATHSCRVADRTDRVIEMENGRIVYSGQVT
jgi:putative ABC transport system ATP-binding protein